MSRLKSVFRCRRSLWSAGLLIALPAVIVGLEHSTRAALNADKGDPQQVIRVEDDNQANDAGNVKTIDVIASRFQFEPATISVVEGEAVRLRLRSADRPHAFAIKAFRVKALIPKMGEEVTVDFVADRAGTFDFTCAEYCGTGHGRMKGRLIVLARGK
jgi:cytochrome c oxidase subunit II